MLNTSEMFDTAVADPRPYRPVDHITPGGSRSNGSQITDQVIHFHPHARRQVLQSEVSDTFARPPTSNRRHIVEELESRNADAGGNESTQFINQNPVYGMQRTWQLRHPQERYELATEAPFMPFNRMLKPVKLELGQTGGGKKTANPNAEIENVPIDTTSKRHSIVGLSVDNQPGYQTHMGNTNNKPLVDASLSWRQPKANLGKGFFASNPGGTASMIATTPAHLNAKGMQERNGQSVIPSSFLSAGKAQAENLTNDKQQALVHNPAGKQKLNAIIPSELLLGGRRDPSPIDHTANHSQGKQTQRPTKRVTYLFNTEADQTVLQQSRRLDELMNF